MPDDKDLDFEAAATKGCTCYTGGQVVHAVACPIGIYDEIFKNPTFVPRLLDLAQREYERQRQ